MSQREENNNKNIIIERYLDNGPRGRAVRACYKYISCLEN